MADDPPPPPPDSGPLDPVRRRRAPARPQGAPRDAGVPKMETVRVTAPDLKRRAALEKTRARLVFAAAGFAALFAAVVIKLADATIIQPLPPHRVEKPITQRFADAEAEAAGRQPADAVHHIRAMITDRNGQILAVSLPTADVYANPREMIDVADAARKLKAALPALDEDEVRQRLSSNKQFVYIAREITPRDEMRINALGIPGVYFEQTAKRRYPMGRTAAQVLGGVDVDGHGVAGAERAFEQRLENDVAPLRLSIDVRIEAVVRDELSKAMDDFNAIGACGIVMDVRTGEVLAMVSLPDYDTNDFGKTPPDDRFNRALTGMYEPGSTFKLQTASMALDSGLVHIWNEFDAREDIHIGRFTISDFQGKHRWLYLPEVLTYSSNLGAAHIAMVMGGERQRAWLRNMGMFGRVGIELPEAGMPIFPPVSNWGEVAVMTIGFGHGIAVSPLHVVRGVAAIANGGLLMRPTIAAVGPNDPPPEGVRIMQQSTSDMMRKLMRLVVTDGYGKPAEVPGYYVGGKTGTAEKVGAHGYKKHANVAAFMGVFPMNAPRYAVYMMLDEPKANASTHGWATAAWVAAPAVGHVIARVGPMLGLLPDIDHKTEIDAALAVPLEPARPAGQPMTPPVAAATPAATPAKAEKPAHPAGHEPRHEASGEHPLLAHADTPASDAAR
ncbi:MAG TPA: penicillin-binding protein 2 [Acidisphaera sp.]|nr:penicillin-binding protein 2 [Acidisphaera sp.]